jgi:hypothetical protein
VEFVTLLHLEQAVIMLSKLQEQQAQDSRRDAWCKKEIANTRESKALVFPFLSCI